MKAFVSSAKSEDYSQRVNDMVVMLDESTHRLGQTQALITSRLESWRNWSSQTKELGDELEKISSTLKLALKEVKNFTSSNPNEVINKKHEAIITLQVSPFP